MFDESKTIPTGIDQLDSCLQGGLKRGGSYLIASVEKAGKSAFIRKIILNWVALYEKKVLLFDTEEMREDIFRVMLAIANKKLKVDVTKEDYEAMLPIFDEHLELIASREFVNEYYIKGEFDIELVANKIRKAKDYGAEIVVFDNVTRLGATDWRPRANAMDVLDRLSRELDILTIVLGHTEEIKIENISKELIKRVLATKQYDALLDPVFNYIPRPGKPFGGSVVTQFRGTFKVWRPFQPASDKESREVTYLLVDNITHAPPFWLRMKFKGECGDFIFDDNSESLGPLWNTA